MRVVVSSLGPTLEDWVDEHFGRARYLLVIDTETLEVQAVDNSANCQALQGAGFGAAEIVTNHGAAAVITGHLGPNAYRALQIAGVPGHDGTGMSVRDAVAAFANGELAALAEGEARSKTE
ncbi:MAG: NifB/NifX family molybdenum-iron cluster-binding protein [Coriobacteriales bacterium]